MAEYLPIAEHGIMGDLHTVALTATDGTIDWYCCPSFDSPSVFASILDREKGGYYRISPAMEGWTPKQLYFPDTNVLITRFLSSDGVGEIQGFMPIAESKEDVHRHRLIRRVEGVRGEMRFRVDLQPRFNYGRDDHEIVQHEHGVVFRSPNLCLALQATTPIACDDRGVHCEFTVRAGSSVTFVLERVEPDYVPREYSEAETRGAYEETIAFSSSPTGPPARSSPRRRRASPRRSEAAATGTTATRGSAMRRSPSMRCCALASPRKRRRSPTGCASGWSRARTRPRARFRSCTGSTGAAS
jgi:Domain of unknown function (DUF5911)